MATTNANGTAPVAVYYPSPSGTPHAYLFNNGPQIVYVGGSEVTTVSGLALYPGNRADLSSAPGAIYGVAGFNQSATVFGTAVTNVAQGGTSITTNNAPGWAVGGSLVIEPGTPRQEILPIGGTSSTAVTVNAGAQFAHGSATSVAYQIAPYITTVKVTGGAT